jgi:hypothetical protein
MRYETPFVQTLGHASDLIQGAANKTGDSSSGSTQQLSLALASYLEQ